MVINSINGTSQLVYSNERVRLAIIDTSGHLSWCAYVHRTKTTHQFDTPSKMLDFAEHFNLIPAAETLTREQFRQRITPFVLRMFAERCEPGMTFHQALAKMQKSIHLVLAQESCQSPHGQSLMTKPHSQYPTESFSLKTMRIQNSIIVATVGRMKSLMRFSSV